MKRGQHRIMLLPIALAFMFGCADRLAFATATKFGLDISQRSDQTFEVTMGYDRAELVSIPVPKSRDSSPTEDAYSVVGTFCVAYGNPFTEIFGQGKPLTITQRFATGMAAQELAKQKLLVGQLVDLYKEEADDQQADEGGIQCD